MSSGDAPVLRGVILDLDGVLVSTDGFHFRAWKELADGLGLDFDEAVNHRLRGVSRSESLRLIFEHNRRPPPPSEEFEELCARKNLSYVELVGRMTPADVLPGAVGLLDELRGAGIQSAVASASRNTPLVLERTGLRAHLDAVAGGNDVSRSKPDPEVFLVAAGRLGLRPEECVGVEDAAAGIEAIHRAGMAAAGIGAGALGAERVFASVGDLSVAALTEVFEAGGGGRR